MKTAAIKKTQEYSLRARRVVVNLFDPYDLLRYSKMPGCAAAFDVWVEPGGTLRGTVLAVERRKPKKSARKSRRA